MKRRGALGGRKWSLAGIAAGLVACLLSAGIAQAAPGDVDRTFGARGAASVFAGLPLEETATWRLGEDMAIGPDGEIYAAVDLWDSCSSGFCRQRLVVQRFRPDGSVDPGFGAAGASDPVEFQAPPFPESDGALALGPHGRPVVAIPTAGDVILARFGPDGKLDPSLGGDGTVTADFGGNEVRPEIAVDGDGRIVLAVESEISGGRSLFVARFLPDGSPDPSFASAGRAAVSNRSLGGLALGPSGTITLGVPGCCALAKSVQVGRLRGGGRFDSRFSRSGWRRLAVGRAAVLSDLIALPGGAVQVVGMVKGAAFAAKLLPRGRLDRDYGNQGFVRMAGIPQRDPSPEAAVDSRGRLIVVGTTPEEEPFSNEVFVLRRLRDGRPDRTFGGGRPVAIGYYLSAPLAVGLQSHGAIVLFAESGFCVRTCSGRAPRLIRFIGGASGARCLGARATVVGTRTSERLIGTPRRDVIAGLDGNDEILGRGGDDLICGGGGRDELAGGPGRDRLRQ